jgi:hypothetical protein
MNKIKYSAMWLLYKDLSEVILGLKRKFSFSYFRENVVKIYFRFSRKKFTKSYEDNESFHDHFCENFREKWRGKRKCRETSEFQEANEVKKL